VDLTNQIASIKPEWNQGQMDYTACVAAASTPVTPTTPTTTTTTVPVTTPTMPPPPTTMTTTTTTTTTLPANAPVTFTQLISNDPILGVFANNCLQCHNRGILPLNDYQKAKANANKILARINSSTDPMPPSGQITPAEIDVVRRWVNGGTRQ
jgi:hypothetical protein